LISTAARGPTPPGLQGEYDEAALRLRLATLRVEHQDLDAAVSTLQGKPMPDQIQIARLKKKKLILRDLIARIEDRLTPDIIA
jgi:hypothetical protein